MSRTRLTIALSLSLVLIGTATWFRFVRTNPSFAQLVYVADNERAAPEEAFIKELFATTSATTLSQTDLVSRQLFSDYVALASRGQADSDALAELAEAYANGILKETGVVGVNPSQINLVADSEENFSRYGQAINSLQAKYKKLAKGLKLDPISDADTPGLSVFMASAANLYKASADELLALKVPVSLSQIHLDLINNYLEDAEAMRALSDLSGDPAQAYAALNTHAQNTKEEEELLLDIQKTMMANGIIFGSGI